MEGTFFVARVTHHSSKTFLQHRQQSPTDLSESKNIQQQTNVHVDTDATESRPTNSKPPFYKARRNAFDPQQTQQSARPTNPRLRVFPPCPAAGVHSSTRELWHQAPWRHPPLGHQLRTRGRGGAHHQTAHGSTLRALRPICWSTGCLNSQTPDVARLDPSRRRLADLRPPVRAHHAREEARRSEQTARGRVVQEASLVWRFC